MRIRLTGPFCVIALLLWSGCSGQQSAPAAGSAGAAVDTRFIPADAFAVYVAYPARVMASPAISKLDLSDFSKDMEKEMGFQLADVEMAEMVLSIAPRKPGDQGPPDVGSAVEVRLTKPHGSDAYIERILSRTAPQASAVPATKDVGGAADAKPADAKPAVTRIEPEKVEYAGKVYYKPGKDPSGYQPNSPTIFVVDDRTLVIGNEPDVKAMMDANEVKSPLVQLLSKVDPTADLSMVAATNDEIQKMVGEAKAKMQLPPPLQPLADATDLLAGSTFAIKTTPEISLSLTLEGKDEAAAEKLVAMVPQAKKAAEQGVALLHGLAVTAPPDQKEMIAYGLSLLDKIVAGLTPQRNGNEVTIQINGLGTLDDLAAKVLMPAIAQARAAAKRAAGRGNLTELGIAMFNYESQFQSFPAHAIMSKEGKPLLSWRVSILPFIDEDALYKQFHLDESWDSPNNRPLIAKMPKVFVDPNGKDAGEGKTRYVVPVGKGTIFDGDQGTKISDISDGTSNTILILEVGEDKAVTWTQPEDLEFDPKNPLAGLGEIADEGINAVFADCHVMPIRKNVDADTFRKLILRADGEMIDPNKY